MKGEQLALDFCGIDAFALKLTFKHKINWLYTGKISRVPYKETLLSIEFITKILCCDISEVERMMEQNYTTIPGWETNLEQFTGFL